MGKGEERWLRKKERKKGRLGRQRKSGSKMGVGWGWWWCVGVVVGRWCGMVPAAASKGTDN